MEREEPRLPKKRYGQPLVGAMEFFFRLFDQVFIVNISISDAGNIWHDIF